MRTRKLLLMHSYLRPLLVRPSSIPCKFNFVLVSKMIIFYFLQKWCSRYHLIYIDNFVIWAITQGLVWAIYFAKLKAVECQWLCHQILYCATKSSTGSKWERVETLCDIHKWKTMCTHPFRCTDFVGLLCMNKWCFFYS